MLELPGDVAAASEALSKGGDLVLSRKSGAKLAQFNGSILLEGHKNRFGKSNHHLIASGLSL